MRKLLLISLIFMISVPAYAGFLGGISAPMLDADDSYSIKVKTSLLMTPAPFSNASLGGIYAINEKWNVYGRVGSGNIDYTTITSVERSSDPQLSSFGFEYVLSGEKKTERYSFVAEYETAAWSINRKSNTSTEIMLALDYLYPISETSRGRYRFGAHNFNSGTESTEDISSSFKYSVITEIETNYTSNQKYGFEAGVFFGDKKGLLAYFGLSIGINI